MDVIKSYNIDINSSLPDHRILTVQLNLQHGITNSRPKSTTFIKKCVPEQFLEDDESKIILEDLASRLTNQNAYAASHTQVNAVYSDFCKLLDKKLTSKEIKPKSKSNSRNKLPNGKAWWNSELISLAKEVRSRLRQWELNKADSDLKLAYLQNCLLYTSPSPRDATLSRMPSSA